MEFTIKSGSPEKQRSACVVVGVFDNRDQADRAVEELRRMGFRDDQIGYAMRGGDNTVAESTGNAAGEGLATGAVISFSASRHRTSSSECDCR